MALGQLNYLQLVNRVLQRLGKSQTTSSAFASPDADSWPGLVKDFINDAQSEVFKEHDWSTLIQSASFTGSTRTKDLTSGAYSGFGREIDLVDTTNRYTLEPASLREIHAVDPAQAMTGAPRRYNIQYPTLTFEMTPSSIAYTFTWLQRPDTLSTYAQVSDLPEYCDMVLVWWAVWQLGASREDNQDRGETARDIYEKSLARAIGQDRRRMDRVYRLQPTPTLADTGRVPVSFGPHYPAI